MKGIKFLFLIMVLVVIGSKTVNGQYLIKSNDVYLHEGKIYTEAQIEEIFKTVPDAHWQYIQSRQKAGSAKFLTYTGIASVSAGLLTVISAANVAQVASDVITGEDNGGKKIKVGIGLIGVGSLLSVIGLNTKKSGREYENRAIQIFNDQTYQGDQSIIYELNLESTNDGIGLCLRF